MSGNQSQKKPSKKIQTFSALQGRYDFRERPGFKGIDTGRDHIRANALYSFLANVFGQPICQPLNGVNPDTLAIQNAAMGRRYDRLDNGKARFWGRSTSLI